MEPVNRQAIEAILRFLPYFRVTDNEFYVCDPSLSLFDPYAYSPEVMEFHDLLYDLGFVPSFDWTAWQSHAKRYVLDPDLVARARIATLQKLLTTHVRKERFCSGHLAAMIDAGHILNILERFEAIYNQSSPRRRRAH